MKLKHPTPLSITVQDFPDGRVGLIVDESTMRGFSAILMSMLAHVPDDDVVVVYAKLFCASEQERIGHICEQLNNMASRRLGKEPE